MINLKEIAKSSNDSYQYAKSLNFQNVPDIILKSIAKDYLSISYARNINYKNIPEIIIKYISKDKYDSLRCASDLKFKNVPKVIMKVLINSSYFKSHCFHNICLDKQFFYSMIKYDKRINL